ncbi:hypothetical protein Sste5346_003865 [Sporothrix stenoceras]|uniref:Transmembrane protein n=1 Tax=Sporothrix stenoceras TaxID=5173 RepID=A0ABR3ZCK5_9PEZI
MAPAIASSTLHGAVNGTHPHCDRLTAAAAAAVASVSSSSQSTRAADDGTASISVLGYVSLGVIGFAILAMASCWLYVYRKGDNVRKQRRPAPLPTATLPLCMADVEGRNSLGSSVRSDIGTHVNLATSGLHNIVEEGSSSAAQMKPAPKKPAKNSVYFEKLERDE